MTQWIWKESWTYGLVSKSGLETIHLLFAHHTHGHRSMTQFYSTAHTNLLPPLFFLAWSMGAGKGLTVFTGGGSCHLSNFPSTSVRRSSPTFPSMLSWKLSTRAASADLAASILAALRRKSWDPEDDKRVVMVTVITNIFFGQGIFPLEYACSLLQESNARVLTASA